jgi:hypothetical protein
VALRTLTEVTVTTVRKKPKATKCSDHHTTSLMVHRAKIIARIIKETIEGRTADVLGEDQFGFRRGKGSSNAHGMLGVMSEFILERKRGIMCLH